jgi:hypothetical protein
VARFCFSLVLVFLCLAFIAALMASAASATPA